jgi:hypothetical protein
MAPRIQAKVSFKNKSRKNVTKTRKMQSEDRNIFEDINFSLKLPDTREMGRKNELSTRRFILKTASKETEDYSAKIWRAANPTILLKLLHICGSKIIFSSAC